ncbi:helix-turn-helix domain-containing protein [Morganella morganii]|uniref:helix-turn-helix domain-containing protein n=1 Tax=Morganella morganii TaxID=582 RepID=UPI00187F19D6|nr:helix-turn-helix domain-containing protein [Morganella morganii]
MLSINNYVGYTVRYQRKIKGWSLEKTAQVTGVSKAMLGQIERGESNPTVRTLWCIASGFNLPLTLFLPGTSENKCQVYDDKKEHLSVIPLQSYDKDLGFELLFVTLDKNCKHQAKAHIENTYEIILPINGQIDIIVSDDSLSVTPGKQVKFKADTDHCYINNNGYPVSFYNIMRYDKKI